MSSTRILIVRHGNTFAAGIKPTRVGVRTDIDLVPSGIAQTRAVGSYLLNNNLVPHFAFCGSLKRLVQTSEQILNVCNNTLQPTIEPAFNEIDYGPDENKSEEEVLARVGQQAMDAWNSKGEPPPGWKLSKEDIISKWLTFANFCLGAANGKTTLVVTSNGIARFAPYITEEFETFSNNNSIKIRTGAICLLEYIDNKWQIAFWDFRP